MDPEVLKRLWEQRLKVAHDIRALAEMTNGRQATAEEKAAEERMSAELADLDGKIEKGMGEMEREKRSAEAFNRYEKLTAGQHAPAPPGDRSREAADAARAFVRGEQRKLELDIDPRVTTFYNLGERRWDPATWERRDLLESTSGMPLPHSFSGRLYEAFTDSVAVLRAKQGDETLFLTTSGEKFDVPRVLDHGGATKTAEATAGTEDDPVITFITLDAFKAMQPAQISQELATDQGFDIIGYLARAMGRNCGLLAAQWYVTGAGTTEPAGFQPNATVGVTGPTGTATSLGAQDVAGQGSDLLYDLVFSVGERYAERGTWVLNRSSLGKIARLKGTNGEPIWSPGLAVGQPDTIIGRPVRTDPNMPVMAANAKSIAFGDFNGYAVRIVRGVTFERSDHFAFTSDLITFKATLRTDGKLIDTGAIKLFQNSAT